MTQPVQLEEILSLTSLGINTESISFSTVTMESDKYLCVREVSGGSQKQVAIIDIQDPSNIIRRPITADSVLMNPVTKVMALKAGVQLQLFDIGKKSKVKSYIMEEEVLFWKWLSQKTLGLVTSHSIYHWDCTDATSEPVKMYDRHATLMNAQIINYRADEDEKWLVLIGLQQEGDRVVGRMQLYSVERRVSQAIEGHAAAFCKFQINSKDPGTKLFVFATKTSNASKFHVIEIGQDKKPSDAPRFSKCVTDIYYPPEAAEKDFPVALQVSSTYSFAYLVTRLGYVQIYDLESGRCLYMNRITESTIFLTAVHTNTGGFIGLNRRGQLLGFSVEPNNFVPYILESLGDVQLAIKVASRNKLPGAEDLYERYFDQLFNAGNYKEAAKVAAESPGGILRTPETIAKFKSVPAAQGQPSALLLYFQALLERGALNRFESAELGGQVVQFGRTQLLERWMNEDKITCSEELGDVVRSSDPKLALQIYLKAEAHGKVIEAFLENGAYDKILTYAKRVGLSVEPMELIQTAVNYSPKSALDLAEYFLRQFQEGTGKPLDHSAIAEMFYSRGLIQEGTTYLLDALKDDRPEDGELQTRLLEVNLLSAPPVADAIMAQNIFHHYDRKKIANLCERQGLFQRALENYSDLDDIKRVMANTHALSPEFLIGYFSNLSPEDSLECLKELLRVNPRGNSQLCAQIASNYADQLGPQRVISLFEERGLTEGVFYFLGGIVNYSEDPDVHFKYIETAIKLGQFHEAERVTRESNFYDPEKVKDFLMEVRPKDPRPLINVCDRFGYIPELIRYMVKNNQLKFIQGYVQRVNPAKTPQVIGALLDLDVEEYFIKDLLQSVKNLVPVDELVDEVERRGRLKILLQFLEAKVADGSTESSVHSALAKVYVDCNINPEHFLETNSYYDPLVVGPYCEKRDPYFAYIAYRKGQCDDELLSVTNRNGLFKEQARYVVEREDPDLWARVLSPDNEHRRQLIDQAVNTALPEQKNPERISVAVKAFMTADLPHELIELLEKLVLRGSGSFANNRNLQNLLILTAIKSDTSRVMDYVRKLDNFDGMDIAPVAIDAGLYEEAFEIYCKLKQPEAAVDVLLEHIEDLNRATEFAEKVNSPMVWSKLGIARLEHGDIVGGVDALMRAKDPAPYQKVVEAARATDGDKSAFEAVIKFLNMARTKVKDLVYVDTELVYAFCVCDRLNELEEFIAGANSANLEEVGDRCFDEQRFNAAKILFTKIGNFAKLAPVLVCIGDYAGAVEAAKKADRLKTWKLVCYACLEAEELHHAQVCGLHIIVEPEELDELLQFYQNLGYFEAAIELLEAGVSLERAHTGIFTELGILYSKYREESLMDHLKMWWQRCSIPRLIRATEASSQWPELCFLYVRYDELDNAANIMMNHSPSCWSHSGFTEVISKVSNMEILYRSVEFYLDEHPNLLNELLSLISVKIDAGRVVYIVRRAGEQEMGPLGYLPLIKPFLMKVQENNIVTVNEALHDIFVDEEDISSLRQSIKKYDNFDQSELARMLEQHELVEMRRIAVDLYCRTGRHEKALELCKKDSLYRDAVSTAADSGNSEMAENLARFFLQNNRPECFSFCLYSCYEIIRADVALELSWQHQATDFTMPYMIQKLHDLTSRLSRLENERAAQLQRKKEKQQAEEAQINEDPSVVLQGLQPTQQTPMLGYGGGPFGNGPSGYPQTGLLSLPPAPGTFQ
jgi:clathrin heavy chain